MALLILYSLWFMLSTTSLWFVKIHNVTNLLGGLLEAGRFPVPAYPAIYRVVLTFIVPVALLTTVPASAVLQRPWGVPWLSALLLAGGLAVLSRAFWHFGLRCYTSASS
jgi:ABC-2 type transport system permease protein